MNLAPMNAAEAPQGIDWLAFCDQDSTRYALDAPWIKDGWKFATNSRVMIAVPVPGEPDSPPDPQGRRFANPLPLLKPVLDKQRRVSIAWHTLPKFESCDKCGNKCRLVRSCSTCRGLLQVKCDMDHYHDCPDCEKTGKENCPCNCFVMLSGRSLATEYFEKVAALPDVAGYYVPNSDPDTAVFFCFGEHRNCFAVLMPLSSEYGTDRIERKAVTV